jgi:hypothetical protein
MYNSATMKTGHEFPGFDEQFSELDQFIIELTNLLQAGNITSWNELDTTVHTFFTDIRMNDMESLVPHWRRMASYANGLTLVHVMCVFMGLYRMPEFLQMSPRQQQIMKWIILLHDVEKQLPDGKRDHGHAFRSTAGAARALPTLGFPVTPEYVSTVDNWDEYTRSALAVRDDTQEVIQDNRKLPHILDGIERMFGHNTPAALILKTILFHLSVDMNFWPPPSPLTKTEVKKYFDSELLPLLRVMSLGDNDGWNMFEPDLREHGRMDTIQVFEQIETFILQGA